MFPLILPLLLFIQCQGQPNPSDTPSLAAPEDPTTPSSTGGNIESPLMKKIRELQADGPKGQAESAFPRIFFRSVTPQQQGAVPDPNRVADPSLLPVHLQKPDYRPLSGGGGGGGGPRPKAEEDETTARVMGVGEEEEEGTTTTETTTTTEGTTEGTTTEMETTTTATTTTEKPEETEEAQEAKAAQEEAEARAKEAAAEAEAARVEAEAKQREAQAAAELAEAVKEKAELETEEAETTKAGEKAPAMEQISSSPLPESAVAALADAIRSAKLLVQNITLVLPGDDASLQKFLNALLGNARGDDQSQSPIQPLPPPMPSFPSAVRTPTPIAFDPPIPPPQQPIAQCRPLIPPFQQSSPLPPFSAPSIGPIVPQTFSHLVDVEQLHSWIKSGQNVKMLDASYEPDPGSLDHVQFYAEYYAKWDKLMREKKGRQYARSHIPGAIPFNLNIATYPSWNERQALYPADKFEQYVRRLGIDRGDQLVVYARGPMGGMLHAARAWFLFRIYGHDNVTVLDGGLDAWRQADLPATDAEDEMSLGNWKAHFQPELVVTFEELTTAESDGYCVLGRLYWYNFLDVRPRNEFFGMAGAQPMGAQRNRILGTKPFPADELVVDGRMIPNGEIIRKLQQIGYSRNYQTLVMGNTADEASLALLALAQVQDTRAKLYNGGMEEIRRRAPYLVSNQ